MKRYYKILLLSVSIIGVYVLTNILNNDSTKLSEVNLLDIAKVNADSGVDTSTVLSGTAGDGDSSGADGG